jgi:uncharacterized protein YbbC (DUF1343 family)
LFIWVSHIFVNKILKMVTTGLESFLDNIPSYLKGKRVGILCHAASITRDFMHVIDLFHDLKEFRLSVVFGPQHGLHGQTQDNMIEWQSQRHPVYNIPLFSLYGKNRKPTPEMLEEIDALIIDLQDTGTRIYTYIWTVKLCLEACAEAGIPVVVLDRPNPIARLPLDGPVLKEEFFTFVGGACIPLCHGMTLGEMTQWIREKYHPSCDLKIVPMENWRRSLLYSDTGLPWVLPSPNMPTLQTAIVYPGTVLIEALNLSEGRGTTLPFELFGAPFINGEELRRNLKRRKIKGCAFRLHNYIPTFHKFCGELCNGMQIHVTDVDTFSPVETAVEIFDAIIETSSPEALIFNPPPYEYEHKLMPFDILSGDSGIRETLLKRGDIRAEKERWAIEIEEFKSEFKQFSLYAE